MDESADAILFDISADHRDLLLRMLAVIARADGEVATLEASFMRLFMGRRENDDMTRVIDAVAAPTDDEVAAAVDGRDVLYRVCALMVCTDDRMTDEEVDILGHYGQVLGLTVERAADLLAQARAQVLERCARRLHGEPHDDLIRRAEALRLVGRQLGVPASDIDALCRRHGFMAE